MFFSKIVLVSLWWKIASAAAVTTDAADCAAQPIEEASVGQRAMLQHSALPSGHIFSEAEIDNYVAPADELMKPGKKADKGVQSLPPVAQVCDWQCYLDRYPDLQEQVGTKNHVGAANHWNLMGYAEGRDCTCGTAQVAVAPEPAANSELLSLHCDWQCYLNRYPDLQELVGTKNFIAAEQHFNNVGKGEGRNCACDSMELMASEPVIQPAEDEEKEKEEEKGEKEEEEKEEEKGEKEEEEKEEERDEEEEEEDEAAQETADSLQAKVTELEAQLQEVPATKDARGRFKNEVLQTLLTCKPLTSEAREALQTSIAEYAEGERLQAKISEAKGETLPTAGHVAIMKYLREKILRPKMSIFDMGCAAGGMLRFIEEEYSTDEALGKHGGLVGVELVSDWVKFAQEQFKDISIYEGDITDYSLPEPYANKTFDLVMLNDVLGQVQKTRLGCFFSQLNRVTHKGSLVYMHSRSPMALVPSKEKPPTANQTSKEKPPTAQVLPPANQTELDINRTELSESIIAAHVGNTSGPVVLLEDKQWPPVDRPSDKTQLLSEPTENIIPHHYVVTGMAAIGFELLSFDHDVDTICGGESGKLPKQLEGAHCYENGWPKYTHYVYRKVHDSGVLSLS